MNYSIPQNMNEILNKSVHIEYFVITVILQNITSLHRVWNLNIFSVSNWDTRIQSLVSPLRMQYPTSGYWLP